jgi:hypothetical protein
MVGDKEQIKAFVESKGWKFSAIDGDPTYGEGVKCYATKHYNYKKLKLGRVDVLVHSLGQYLRDQGVRVMREKVELVCVDRRYQT